MTKTRVRDADPDETALITLVVNESSPHRPHPVCDNFLITRLAVTDGQISGFHRVKISTTQAEPRLEVEYLFVYEQWRRHGVGKALFDDACRIGGQFGQRCVRIVSHPPIESFYRRVGARRTGTQAPDTNVRWARPVLEAPSIPSESASVVAYSATNPARLA